MGSRLIPELSRRGHKVRALVRAGSEKKLPAGCAFVTGDALRAESYRQQVAPADTFVHLIGVSHPSPAKAEQFRKVDLVSIEAAGVGAGGGRDFVFLSVWPRTPPLRGDN